MAINQENLERLGPRLRVVCNGDAEVNELRAQLSAAVEAKPSLAKQRAAHEMLQQAVSEPKKVDALAKPPSDQQTTDTVKVSCFVRLAGPETKLQKLPGKTVQRGDLVTVQMSPREIEKVANRGPASGIAYIDMGEPLSLPHAVLTARRVSEPPSRAPELTEPSPPPQVLIGIIDVGGFDFTHPDFLDANRGTRFVRIWDQGAPKRSVLGKPPRLFGYGAELTQDRMKQALDWSRSHAIGATDLLRQSVQLPGAHATHVASIAAGNRGVCSHAAIAGVLIALSEQERERHATLYDSTRLAHAVDYLFALGERLYDRPIPTVVNISLGTNGHAHDGSSAICRRGTDDARALRVCRGWQRRPGGAAVRG